MTICSRWSPRLKPGAYSHFQTCDLHGVDFGKLPSYFNDIPSGDESKKASDIERHEFRGFRRSVETVSRKVTNRNTSVRKTSLLIHYSKGKMKLNGCICEPAAAGDRPDDVF